MALTELADRFLQWERLQATLSAATRLTSSFNHRLEHRAAWIAAVLFVLALQSALVLTHWPWLDEWQALQIAVQSPTIEAMMHNLHYEGHPPLWYFILRYAERVVPPLWTLQAVALPMALATQLMILFASPFTRAHRFYIATSQFVLFEMLTISRSFTLGTLFIVLALALWRRRLVWLPIALLPMCDFLFGVFSVCLIVLQWRRRSLFWPGLALWIVIGLVSAWTVRLAPDAVPALATKGLIDGIGNFASIQGLNLLPFQWADFGPGWNSRLPLLLLPFGWMGFIWFAFVQTRRGMWNRVLVFGFVGLILVMCLFVYPLSFRHALILALLLIALAWIDLVEKRPGSLEPVDQGFNLWLAAASACGLFTAVFNFIVPFDRAHIAVREIERRGLQHERWLVIPLDHAQGMPALSGMVFENPSIDCIQSFVPWTSHYRPEEQQEVVDYLKARIAREGQFYLVTSLKFEFLPPEIAKPIVIVGGGYNRIRYELFLVGPNAPRKQRHMPPCVPGMLPLRALPPSAAY